MVMENKFRQKIERIKNKYINNVDNLSDRDAGLSLILILLIAQIITKSNLIITITFLLICVMTVPFLFRPFNIFWSAFSNLLGCLSSHLILTFLFVFIVIPIGLIRRLLGADPLQLKRWKINNQSAFLKRDHLYESSDMEKPF